jgi:hypothetical protein
VYLLKICYTNFVFKDFLRKWDITYLQMVVLFWMCKVPCVVYMFAKGSASFCGWWSCVCVIYVVLVIVFFIRDIKLREYNLLSFAIYNLNVFYQIFFIVRWHLKWIYKITKIKWIKNTYCCSLIVLRTVKLLLLGKIVRQKMVTQSDMLFIQRQTEELDNVTIISVESTFEVKAKLFLSF